MGKGLFIEPKGTYLAFTAGTGSLVFLDLVAHLLRKHLGLLESDEMNCVDESDFQFNFYVSYPNRTESVALKFLEGMDQFCKKFNKNYFKLHLRITAETKQRWDESFIEKQLNANKGKIKRVWVCGPPLMNLNFDKTL